MKTTINKILVIALMILFTTAVVPTKAFAQTTQAEPEERAEVDESDPPPPPDDEDPDAPIDGGLSILIAGGIGYGVKKALQKRKSFGKKGKNSL